MIFIPSNNVHVRRSENFTAVCCAVCLINHTYIDCSPPSEYHTLSKCILLIVKKKFHLKYDFIVHERFTTLAIVHSWYKKDLTNKAFFI